MFRFAIFVERKREYVWSAEMMGVERHSTFLVLEEMEISLKLFLHLNFNQNLLLIANLILLFVFIIIYLKYSFTNRCYQRNIGLKRKMRSGNHLY